MDSNGLKWVWGIVGSFVVLWAFNMWGIVANLIKTHVFFGEQDLNSSIILSFPVIGGCIIILAITAILYAWFHRHLSVKHRLVHFTTEGVNGASNWFLSTVIMVLFLGLPTGIQTHLIIHINRADRASIWDRDTGKALPSIYHRVDDPFNTMRYRWDTHGGKSAFPCYQAYTYDLIYVLGLLLSVSAGGIILLPPWKGKDEAVAGKPAAAIEPKANGTNTVEQKVVAPATNKSEASVQTQAPVKRKKPGTSKKSK